MRRAGLAFALALPLFAASAAPADPAKPGQAAPVASEVIAAGWEARLADAEAKLAAARSRAARSEQTLTHARHRKYPRGEALDALIADAEEAREALAAAEAEVPALLEQARRAGVEPGVLRRFEPED